MVKHNTTFLTSFFVCFYFFSFSQEMQWASSLKYYSTERSKRQYNAKQVLGKPNAILGNPKNSPCVWMPLKESSKAEEYVVVRFSKPLFAKKIVICEVQNPGAVAKVFTINTGGFEKLVYESESPKSLDKQTNVLNIIFEEPSKTKIQEVKVVLNTKAVKGYNGIDAIGISESEMRYEPTINTVESAEIYKRQNLGNGINSTYSEYLPQISPDGKILFFSRRDHHENTGSRNADDIWFSESEDGERWSEAKNISAPLNDEYPNYVYTITPDGNTILVGNIYRKGEVPLPGISKSYQTSNGWSYPEGIQINEFKNISPNNEFYLSANKRTLLMTIDDGNSFGDTDIYVSFLNQDKTWTKPKNIGSMVNTAAAEVSPFLAADNTTLYFSSNGYLGYGKNDIYVTKRLDDTWQNWSEPINLGASINTDENEFYYSIPASGNYAYFVSQKQTLGNSDIFKIQLPEAVKPFPVTMITGKIYNLKTGDTLHAEVHYDLLPEGADVGEGETNFDGVYKIIIPQDHMYGIHAQKEGYFPVSTRIDEENISDHHYHVIEMDLYLVPLEVEAKFILHNVVFNRSKAELQPFSYVELSHLARLLQDNPSMEIKLIGHTDNSGYQDWNKKLSLERVQHVKDFLISKGISKDRLLLEGKGGNDPLFPNNSEENKTKNRRVEVEIIKL